MLRQLEHIFRGIWIHTHIFRLKINKNKKEGKREKLPRKTDLVHVSNESNSILIRVGGNESSHWIVRIIFVRFRRRKSFSRLASHPVPQRAPTNCCWTARWWRRRSRAAVDTGAIDGVADGGDLRLTTVDLNARCDPNQTQSKDDAKTRRQWYQPRQRSFIDVRVRYFACSL